MNKTVFNFLAGAALSITVFASAGAQTRGGTLTTIIQPEPVILSSALNTAAPTGFFSANVFDGLLEYDNNFKLRPALAQSWNISKDSKTLTFHLRHGVKWHDGQPFTSADVKWTLENVWKKIHPRNQIIFATVTSVDTPDDYTVIIHFSQPSLAVLSSLNSNGAQVLPKHLYEGTDILNNPYNNKPVGTGPFVFKEWSKGNYITLERNPNYWDKGKPYLDKIVFKVIPDAGARAAALETGEVQYAPFSPVPLKDADRLSKLSSLKLETRGYEWLSPWLFLDINVDRPYFKDARVRQALAYAIDRNALNKVVWYGFGKPAVSPVVSTLKQFHTDDVPKYDFDPKKAEALLDAAGLKRDADGVRLHISLDFLPYGDDYKRSGEYIKQALKRVGIDVNLRAQDTPTYTRRVYGDRDYDLSVVWFAGFADPLVGVTRAYWSDSVGKNIPWSNGSGYRNSEADKLIEQATSSPDQNERIALFKKFQQRVETDLPSIPLLELHFFTVHSVNLKDAVSGVDQAYGSLKNAWFDSATKVASTAAQK
ncbi:peptide/nickel transport system substrate-binding protein [Herbaspirillum sp. Sphag1AN]|uniref:ABC transporter substrate-binding protein n=1 Tax=unclassified Herbaspirillum TaxID=2624150 RepID=UPI00161DB09A|nr:MULTISPECIES: ABC transporter substrate-binding protein [unclassified Herbaspirillum]MBB3211880.1 peptide/nickel transport system substrate-binding protein [Herbaspirillum sp. Sphag1AN]MBB3244286.1 peptide/nickel transport system substrate-binding protein [Herbaspirillum sp. Sphag64]